MEFYAQIKNGRLLPTHNSDYDKVAKLKGNQIYKVTIKEPRNIAFHRKFFSLINMVYNNQEQFSNEDHLRKYLTMKAGFYETVPTPKGEMVLPKSISFSNMDEIEFNEVYSRVLDVCCNFLDITNEQVEMELVNYF